MPKRTTSLSVSVSLDLVGRREGGSCYKNAIFDGNIFFANPALSTTVPHAIGFGGVLVISHATRTSEL